MRKLLGILTFQNELCSECFDTRYTFFSHQTSREYMLLNTQNMFLKQSAHGFQHYLLYVKKQCNIGIPWFLRLIWFWVIYEIFYCFQMLPTVIWTSEQIQALIDTRRVTNIVNTFIIYLEIKFNSILLIHIVIFLGIPWHAW